jgi:cytochrome c oxidase subunit II
MQPPVVRSRVRTLLRIGIPLLLIAMTASGCLLPPDPATDAGQDVFNLYLIVLALAAIVFIGVEGFILYAIFRYRRKPGDDVLPEQHHGNTAVEIVWTIIPTVIVFILFGFSLVTLGEVEARAEEPGVEIRVEGFQWNWRFHYPDEVVSSPQGNEPPVLAVPVGEPVRLVLESIDVNHAFYVPQFLIKRDLIPVGENGRLNELEFVVNEAGTYAGQCAEFCGTAHADMRFTVEAMERADYDAWLAALASGEPPPAPGAEDCSTTIQLTASELAFDTNSIEVPAGEDFCVELTNDDTVAHDFGIVETEYNGDDVDPGETITYLVPALEAGDYTFFCTLHPTTMVGDLIVGE